MKTSIIILIILGVLLFILLSYFIYSIFIFNYLFKRKEEKPLLSVDLKKTKYAPYIAKIKKYNNEFKDLAFIDVEIKSFDNLNLKAKYLNNNSDLTIIMVHGYRATPDNNFAIPAVHLNNDLKCNLLIIYQRAHGLSEGNYVTFGYNERNDIISWIKYINDNYNPKNIILYGVSMGAGTILLSSSLIKDDNVKGLIVDCGYDNIKDAIKTSLKLRTKFTPRLLLLNLMILAKFKHFSLNKYKPCEEVKNNKINTLFIHGNNDKLVPITMGKNNYNNCNSNKEFYETSSYHAMSIYTDTESVIKKEEEFINKCIK